MPFAADDLGAWLVGLLADAGRKRLTTWVLGTEQERSLRQAAGVAVELTARQLRPEGGARAEELVMVVSHVFTEPGPDASSPGQATLLEALQAGIAGHLAVLDDCGRTGTERSSADVLGVPAATLAVTLAGHLVREIVVRGSRGGPLEPLAAQLNHDVTHLQAQRLEGTVGQAGEVREALARLEAGQPPPVSSLGVRYSLPPDAAAFTGRDAELDRIMAAVTQAAGGGGVVAIHAIGGMPGVGKTALAVHAAHLLRDRFPDRQLFIDLHAHTPGQDPLIPQAALAGLLTAVGVDARYHPGDLDGRAGLWRDRMAGQRALLVLDNAASSAQVAPLLPGGEGCLVLVTSRRHLGDLPGVAAPLPLQTLPLSQAQEMFVRLAPRARVGPAGAVAELVRMAGFLPLAISLLARVYARHPFWTLADLPAETRASMLTLTAETDSVAAAFEVSYRYLAPGQQEFFRRLDLHPGTTIDAYAAAALAATGLQDAAGQLDALHGEGLLTEAGYRRYGMHDLIRRYARDLAAIGPALVREQALDRLLDYYQHTAAITGARLARQTRTRPANASGVPPAVFPDLPDRTRALAWARTERGSLLACLDHVTRSGQGARVVALTAAMAAFLRIDGPWTDAIARHATAVQAARHLGDRPGVANALTDLGIMQHHTGDYPGAAQALEEGLGISRELGSRRGQANALSDLGAVWRLTGNYQGAARALEEALGLYRDLGDRGGAAAGLNEAGSLHRVRGDLPAAGACHRQALHLAREIGSSWNEAQALAGLGRCALAAGRTADWEVGLRQAREIFRRIGAAEASGVSAELDALTDSGPEGS